MRCLMCHADMVVIKAVSDDSIAVPGFERHTLQCSSCGDVEQRLVFSSKATSGRAADVPPHEAPPVSPAPAHENEPTDSPGLGNVPSQSCKADLTTESVARPTGIEPVFPP
jgi:hypothetical protein